MRTRDPPLEAVVRDLAAFHHLLEASLPRSTQVSYTGTTELLLNESRGL